ncbi:MAG: hypothetical protein J6K72_01945 [Clostridia bacterium]|nr:hypothetical protein [Clostridia bacterium]
MAKQADQQKGLRHLSRSELIEIIYRQQILLEDLQQRLSDSKEKEGQLSEQIRNFEANRSLSARTEQLGADIQNMSRQLDHLNEIIRRNYSTGSAPASTENKAFMPPIPPPPAPPKSRPAPANAPAHRRVNRFVPPVPVQEIAPEPPTSPLAEDTASPTIAQQLKGQPFR